MSLPRVYDEYSNTAALYSMHCRQELLSLIHCLTAAATTAGQGDTVVIGCFSLLDPPYTGVWSQLW